MEDSWTGPVTLGDLRNDPEIALALQRVIDDGGYVPASERPGRVYSIEVRYRDGQVETFPPDYRFLSDQADPAFLWICDGQGPLYRRAIGRGVEIALREVAA